MHNLVNNHSSIALTNAVNKFPHAPDGAPIHGLQGREGEVTARFLGIRESLILFLKNRNYLVYCFYTVVFAVPNFTQFEWKKYKYKAFSLLFAPFSLEVK